MTAEGPGPRERLIASAIALVREEGVHAAGLAELLARSNTARNSLYQHFPAGKSQLIEESTRVAGAHMTRTLTKLTDGGSPEEWIAKFVGWWKKNLQATEYVFGCPVVGAALAESEPAIQAAAGEAFTTWGEIIAASLIGAGVPEQDAGSLGRFALSAIEGAVIQARATKSVVALDDAQRYVVDCVAGARLASTGTR